MKKIIPSLLFLGLSLSSYAQSENSLLKELSEKACKCIDSISITNKTSYLVSKEASACIDKEVTSYQLGSQLMGSLSDLGSLLDGGGSKDSSKNVTLNISTNKDSDGYKKAYNEFESYLMNSCPVLKQRLSGSDIIGRKSLSENEKALKYYYKGIAKHEKGNEKKAVKYFKKALEVDSVFAFAWDNLGLSYRKMNKFDEAIHAYETSLKIEPYGAMPLQNIAIAYQYKQEYQKAIDAYKRLAEINPENPEIFYGIGQVYSMNLNKYEEGLDNICKAYNIYVEMKSPFRADAEKIISYIYGKMKEEDKLEKFDEILKNNNLSQ